MDRYSNNNACTAMNEGAEENQKKNTQLRSLPLFINRGSLGKGYTQQRIYCTHTEAHES